MNVFFAVSVACGFLIASGANAETDPLAPLTGEEIATAVDIVKQSRRVGPNALFPYVVLEEPSKTDVAAFRTGAPFPRVVEVITSARKAGVMEWRVDLREGKVLASKPMPDGEPPILPFEYTSIPEAVRKDPRWREALKARGIENINEVTMDVWAVGPFIDDKYKGLRMVHVVPYFKGPFTNAYAHPIELTALFDATHGKIVEIRPGAKAEISRRKDDFDDDAVKDQTPVAGPAAASAKKIDIDGHRVRWNGWAFRFALHPREGLVLYAVSHRGRPVLHRAGLSEMVVPYADSDGNWVWRNAFDVGEYGEGRMVSPQAPGLDAPSGATLLDAELADEFGKPMKVPRAIAVYERDGGVLWRHQDVWANRTDSRRASELVVQFIATVSNYDYLIDWVFKQDGSIEFEAGLTGIMLTKSVGAEHSAHTGHSVAPGVLAVHHQHFFNMRLDFDVDGEKNSVAELETEPVPAGGDNPFGNVVRVHRTVLRTEKEAGRDMNLAGNRRWIVFAPSKKNELGEPTGYALLPGENAMPFLSPDSPVRKKARFVDHHFWVTRYHAGERYAAGEYPNQGPAGDGLPKFVADDESIEDQDLVAWYTFGVSHLPRPEEWPVMPVHKTGFKLVPVGFYSMNPAMGPQR